MSGDCCAHGDVRIKRDAEVKRLRDLREIQLAVASGALLATGLILELVVGADTAATVAFVAALATGGWTFVPDAVRGLVRGRLGVGTLMAIAATGAVILGELEEAAVLAFLFSVAEALEGYAHARTRRGLRALLELVPPAATVVRDGREQTLEPAELRPGQVLLVRPGERVATDGVIRTGRSALDVSAVTGESLPVGAGPGDAVFAASVNGGGALEIEVTAGTEENSLARIVRIVEEAQERKGRSQRLAERVARPLVPGVLIAASLVAVIGSVFGEPREWILRSLVVLVAAAPCAFAISVPVTVVAAIGAATRSGVLVKGGGALEALGHVRAVAIDKTGTLTRNDPQVIDVVSANGAQPAEILRAAAALEARSEHPLAQAILARADGFEPADDVEAVAGSGLRGSLGGAPVRLGRPGFVAAGPLAAEVARLQADGATVVLVERAGGLLGAIAVRDELRPEALELVHELRRAGVEEIAMLTGDNRRSAEALARAAGIETVYAELLPEEKAAAVAEIRRRRPVAMVGDGINDAPALATADVGIAMGAIGADVAIETADVALMGEDLRHLADTLRHATRATRIARQNLFLSAGILVTLIPLAALGVLGLAAVVAVHEVAEVIVIANGIRAGRRTPFRSHDSDIPRRVPALHSRPPDLAQRPKRETAAVLADESKALVVHESRRGMFTPG